MFSRRITVTSDGDGELASTGDHDTPSGKTLRLLGFGGCTLRPLPDIMRVTVSSGRKLLHCRSGAIVWLEGHGAVCIGRRGYIRWPRRPEQRLRVNARILL